VFPSRNIRSILKRGTTVSSAAEAVDEINRDKNIRPVFIRMATP